MSVSISSPVSVVSPPIARSFSDNFDRADTTAYWGEPWYPVMSISAVDFQPQDIVAMIQINSLHGRFKNKGTGGGGNGISTFMVPRSPIVTSLYGRRQFSQATFVNGSVDITNPLRTGPAVMITPSNNDSSNVYSIYSSFENGTFFFARGTGPGRVVLVNALTLLAGDVLRVEAIPLGLTTNLNVLRNGVSVFSTIDGNGPKSTGVPGMTFDSASNGTAALRFNDWDNYQCGVI